MFFKKCSLIRKIITIIFVTTAFNVFCLLLILVPIVKQKTFELEEKNGKLQLEKVISLVHKTYQDLEEYKQFALESRKNSLKNLTLVAESYINHFYENFKKGAYQNEETAKSQVLDTVKDFRYGNKDYFFISDYNSILISHPSLMYEDFSNIKDVYENLIVPPMIEIARKHNEGFHSYWWNRLDKKEPSEKLTYIKHFPQWNWVFGTGVYVDDIKEEVDRRKAKLIDELRNTLKDIKIGKTGYLFIFDSKLNMIIHPNQKLEGKNFANLKIPGSDDNLGEQLVKAVSTPNQSYYYLWDKPDDPDNFSYKKVSWIRYFKPLDIYIASSAYLSEIEETSETMRVTIIGISLFSFLISFIITFLVVRNTLKPINILSNTARRIKDGDLSARSKIHTYDENGRLISEDEIGILSAEFDNMIQSFQDSQKQLIGLNETLEQKIDERTQELHVKNQKIETLLHNSGVGFLSFGSDLLVDSEYSVECKNIFGKNIEDISIADILLPEKSHVKEQFISNLEKIFAENIDLFKKEIFLSLLPKVFHVNKKNVSVEHRLLDDNKMMLVLHDITYQTELRDKIKEEQERLKFIVGVIRDKGFVLEILNDFLDFRNSEFEELIKSNRPFDEMIAILYRKAHTFKGLFLQFGFIHLSKILHEFENMIKEYKLTEKDDPLGFLDCCNLSDFDNAYVEDMEIIIKNLGKEFLEDVERVRVKKDDVIKILENDSPEELKSLVKKLLYVNIKSLIIPYIRVMNSLAFRFGKELELIDISGDDVFVDQEIYNSFTRSLIHVFRNIVDHGIETPVERTQKGKSSAGNVTCDITMHDKTIKIQISDDGQGINIEKIRKKAVELGIYEQKTIDLMDEKDIIALILNDTFSTKEHADQLSGRGVGLAAVMEELNKLNGKLDIITKKDEGTTFIFTIPFIEKS